LAATSGNRRLAGLVSGLMDDLTRLLHMGLGLCDHASLLRQEHVDLAQAVAGRRPEEAESLLRQQIERSQQIILESLSRGTRLQETPEPPGTWNPSPEMTGGNSS
jgi:DNA-binding GntR family transcriptional regulator